MYDPDAPLVTLNDILSAREFQKSSELCIHTPMIHHVQDRVGIPSSIDLHLKLETMQKTGSFKPRGIINQLRYIPDKVLSGEQTMVTLSAGNYGKAFAVATQIKKLKALVIMASSAPDNRETVIKSYGAQVERYPTPELVSAVDRSVAERGMIFMHSFDDAALIAGHGSLGLEIMEDVSDPDVVVVCCGGGGLIAGTAAAIKLSGKTSTRIYGVEPEGASTMYKSRKLGHPVKDPNVKTIASGLAPPYTGPNCYRHNIQFVDDMFLVSDDQIRSAVKTLYQSGLVVEPSGAAAFAALQNNKIPNVDGKKVVVVLTGGNMTPGELVQIMAEVKT